MSAPRLPSRDMRHDIIFITELPRPSTDLCGFLSIHYFALPPLPPAAPYYPPSHKVEGCSGCALSLAGACQAHGGPSQPDRDRMNRERREREAASG